MQKKPLKTSKTFDTKTLDDNQYYISICLCITLIALCNPFALICCIPAFHFASKVKKKANIYRVLYFVRATDDNILFSFIIFLQSAKETKQENHDSALDHHRKAQYLNVGGFIYLVASGLISLIILTIVVSVGAVIGAALANSSNSNSGSSSS